MQLFATDGTIKMSSLFVAPLRRIFTETPELGAVAAAATAGWQWVTGKPFHYAVTMVLITMAVDYIAGTVTAHRLGEYKSGIAYNGALSKLMGLAIILLIRGLEGFVSVTHVLETNGALATASAVSLIAVDIVSISKHRARLGGDPIPFIGAAMDWIQDNMISKFPGMKKKDDSQASHQ